MKILLYWWKAYSNYFLKQHLERLGYEVSVWENDDAQERLLAELKKGYTAAFSYNYFAPVAIACHELGVPYISWTQDSPMLSLYDSSTYFETNYFFCFDFEQYNGMKQRGISNAYYCPLAVDLQQMSAAAESGSRYEYASDISFVGSLYSEKNMFSELDGLPGFLKGYINGIVQVQMKIPEVRFSQTMIPDSVMKPLKQILNFKGIEDRQLSFEMLVENLIDRQVTVLERRKMIQMLSELGDFKLYTSSDTGIYPQVRNCGKVEYLTEMPMVFRQSQININVSLRSIRTGIPLRILDVIACGGFCLTNQQNELFEYFEEGKSIATFYNLEDMREKCIYYLAHEEERVNIIREGCEVIRNHFDFSVRLPEIMKTVGIL